MRYQRCPSPVILAALVCFATRTGSAQPPGELNATQLAERFGEEQFAPEGGFVLRVGQQLPRLVWKNPELVAKVIDEPAIPTRWFNARFQQVETAGEPGRYYAYGEAPVPAGPVLRRAMTCCCVAGDLNLSDLAAARVADSDHSAGLDQQHPDANAVVRHWHDSEQGAIELAAILEYGRMSRPPRRGQWQMEEATRHVRLKRRLMGWEDKPIRKATPRRLPGKPANVLRTGPLEEAGISRDQVRELEVRLDQWYAASEEPMAVVVARRGVIVLAKSYGEAAGQPVTVDTPMALDSAMKPLIGLQLATFVDRGILRLDEPIGNYLPDFDTPGDQNLTFRAGHVHATGIHFPWDLAFSRLFYFHTWHESLIAHCRREWPPGERQRYGVVGVILSVRALELVRGRNYWDAMERDLFEPLGIRNVQPHNGFSAESLARIGVLLDNRGSYGPWEVISPETHESILPTSLQPWFPDLKLRYGIGLQDAVQHLGQGAYGHGGGCGTLLAIQPRHNLVFAMVRNAQGRDFSHHRAEVTGVLKKWFTR
ncbi:MAG: serine hydrolase domain-containing protein [Fuerstiella sp.]